MTGAEPTVGSAAWSAAVGSVVLGAATPNGVANLIVAVAGVVLGIITRRTLASARGATMPRWKTEFGLSFVQILISMVVMRYTGFSGIGAIWIGGGVATLGAPLIERLIVRFELWLNRLIPELPPVTPAGPSPQPTTMFVSPGTTANIPAAAPDVTVVDVVDGPEKASAILITEFKASKLPPRDARMELQLERLARKERKDRP